MTAADAARARIAAAVAASDAEATLGEVTLRPHQRTALALVRRHLDRFGGCLLADDVGRGKTFVALAAARRWARPLVVAPASLRGMWRDAMRRAGGRAEFASHEALSRGVAQPETLEPPDGIVVDESHHFRNPGTRRHAALAELSARAELLLLSATPVQNARRDLAAQLSLFLGGAAFAADEARLAAHVLRVDAPDAEAALPALAAPRWTRAEVDDGEVLRAILALPPPPRALGAGDAGALRVLSLVRAWASSRAALVATLGRRRREATGLEQSVEAGRLPTVAELRAWRGPDDGAQQLGFAAVLVAGELEEPRVCSLRVAIEEEHEALGSLLRLLRARPDPDVARARALLRILAAHPRERVVAFTGFASTARAYCGLLRERAGVGLLTAEGGRIASGPIARDELLARFAPRAQGCREPPHHERVSLLVTTDLLSEGVNLQDASVVVHLDLPWNPARLAQRVGRARRPDGAPVVSSYLVAPPADAELLLDVERRLRRKLAGAERTIGRGIEVVPALTLSGVARARANAAGFADARAALHRRIARWAGASDDRADACIEAGVTAEARGWLALLGDGTLLAAVGDDVGDGAALLQRAVAAASGRARRMCPCELGRARAELDALRRRRRLADDCGLAERRSPVAGAVERRVARVLARAGRHERARLVELAAPLRHAVTGPITLGAERALARLIADRGLGDEEALRRMLATVAPGRDVRPGASCDVPRVVIVFGPGSEAGAPSPPYGAGANCVTVRSQP